MFQVYNTLSPLPASGAITSQPSPVVSYGFDLSEATAMDPGASALIALFVCLIASLIIGTIITTSNAAADNKSPRRIILGCLAGVALATACTILLGTLLAPYQSLPDQSAAFTSWAADTYDVEVSRAGFVALTSGESVAVAVSGTRTEVHLGAAQDGLFYLFDSAGTEVPLAGGFR